MSTLRFPVERTGGNKAQRLAALLHTLHVMSELEDQLERAGALKGVYLLFQFKRDLAAEYPEFFAQVRLDGGGT